VISGDLRQNHQAKQYLYVSFGISLGKRIISLDSEFEDSPRPETSKKNESVLAGLREPRFGLEAETSEAYYKNTRIPETNLGMLTPKPNYCAYISEYT